MGSEQRQRPQGVFVRLDDDEKALLVELARQAKCSTAEMVRAILFDREPVPPVFPCSPHHENCTPHHRNLVDGYRDQREREERAVELETGGYVGDLKLWRAQGGTMTTFVDWLKACAS